MSRSPSVANAASDSTTTPRRFTASSLVELLAVLRELDNRRLADRKQERPRDPHPDSEEDQR